jgi:hypothetical protein
MKPILRRLQQLEQRRSEQRALMDTSGAKERFLANIARTAERLRSNPNWTPPTESEAQEIKQRLKAFFAARANGT